METLELTPEARRRSGQAFAFPYLPLRCSTHLIGNDNVQVRFVFFGRVEMRPTTLSTLVVTATKVDSYGDPSGEIVGLSDRTVVC